MIVKGKGFLSLIFCVLIFSLSVFAEEGEVSEQRESSQGVGLEFGIYGASFVSSNKVYFTTRNTFDHLLALGLQYNKFIKYSSFEFGANIGGLYSLHEKKAYPKLIELYASYVTNRFSFSVGQKKMIWSLEDRVWERGFWANRFQWDMLDVSHQGSFGTFVTFNMTTMGKTTVTLYGSPLFVPELISDPQTNFPVEGEVEKNTPWSQGLKSTLSFQKGRQLPFSYSLEDVSLNEILFKYSLGGQWKWESDSNGFFLTASYAYKPINQIFLAAPIVVDLTKETTPITFKVNPFAFYHHLGSVEWGRLTKEGISFWVSANYEKPLLNYPEHITTPTEDSKYFWLYQELADSKYFSSYLSYSTKGYEFYLTGTYVMGGKLFMAINDGGDFEIDFSPRHRFSKALKVGGRSQFDFGRLIVEVGGSALYDMDQKGAIAGADVRILLDKNFRLSLQADFLGFLDDEAASSSGFISEFRANDRVLGVLEYVF